MIAYVVFMIAYVVFMIVYAVFMIAYSFVFGYWWWLAIFCLFTWIKMSSIILFSMTSSYFLAGYIFLPTSYVILSIAFFLDIFFIHSLTNFKVTCSFSFKSLKNKYSDLYKSKYSLDKSQQPTSVYKRWLYFLDLNYWMLYVYGI